MAARSPRIIAFIPARYASTRFPGKPLALIDGSPMIQHVYERVSSARKVKEVYVATDDKRIADAVEGFGGKYIMTPPALGSGTDRCAFAARKIKADVVVNVQGDEPVISPKTIDAAISILLKSPDCDASTAAFPISDHDTLFSENAVKVVLNRGGDALYFTRAVVPFLRGVNSNHYLEHPHFLKHLGIYVYRNAFLQKLTKMKQTPLEAAEKLEQLRILENGYRIKVAIVDEDSISVDVPSDVIAVEKYLSDGSIGPDSTSKNKRSSLG
ncbi:MAG TPA: 3-deoxy-manno-octulosonate cytidylyltransferase [Candidatus Kryptonia bacterium]